MAGSSAEARRQPSVRVRRGRRRGVERPARGVSHGRESVDRADADVLGRRRASRRTERRTVDVVGTITESTITSFTSFVRVAFAACSAIESKRSRSL